MSVIDQVGAPWLGEVLSTVAEFGSASIGLVAWELCLNEEAVAPAWSLAVRRQLLAPDGDDPETGEPMFRISRA